MGSWAKANITTSHIHQVLFFNLSFQSLGWCLFFMNLDSFTFASTTVPCISSYFLWCCQHLLIAKVLLRFLHFLSHSLILVCVNVHVYLCDRIIPSLHTNMSVLELTLNVYTLSKHNTLECTELKTVPYQITHIHFIVLSTWASFSLLVTSINNTSLNV